jgi:hypothetical protein
VQKSERRAGSGRFIQRATALMAAALVTISAAPHSWAEDLGPLVHDLSSGNDFRLRVEAALSLGRTKSPEAIAPLLAALDDGHPAVRAAAAAALAALGRHEAIDPLRAHLARESAPSVQSQMRAALERLMLPLAERAAIAATARAKSAKVLVKVGELRNLTASRGPQVAEVFRGATRAKAAELPGVEVLDDDCEGRSESASRKLPVLVLDGVVNRLASGAAGERLSVSAQVEFTFRKIPEHALRGTVTGAARAEGGAATPRARQKMAELENQALCGAVESAMRGAPEVMLAALR